MVYTCLITAMLRVHPCSSAPSRLMATVINRMTLDLRAFSRTGGWFVAARATAAHGSDDPTNTSIRNGDHLLFSNEKDIKGNSANSDGGDDEVDYVVSELTLTRTLRGEDGFDTDIKLRSTAQDRRSVGPSRTLEDGKIRVDIHVHYS